MKERGSPLWDGLSNKHITLGRKDTVARQSYNGLSPHCWDVRQLLAALPYLTQPDVQSSSSVPAGNPRPRGVPQRRIPSPCSVFSLGKRHSARTRARAFVRSTVNRPLRHRFADPRCYSSTANHPLFSNPSHSDRSHRFKRYTYRRRGLPKIELLKPEDPVRCRRIDRRFNSIVKCIGR